MDRRMNIELDKYITREPDWNEADDVVADGSECPECGEARLDCLCWQEDGEHVHCDTCGHVYTPGVTAEVTAEYDERPVSW